MRKVIGYFDTGTFTNDFITKYELTGDDILNISVKLCFDDNDDIDIIDTMISQNIARIVEYDEITSTVKIIFTHPIPEDIYLTHYDSSNEIIYII